MKRFFRPGAGILLCLSVVIVLFVAAWFFFLRESEPAVTVEAGVDLSLTRELEWCGRNPGPYSQPPENAYVPEGAQILSIEMVDEVLVVDYRLDSARYIVDYFSDGTIRKTARADESSMIYAVSSNQDGAEVINIDE